MDVVAEGAETDLMRSSSISSVANTPPVSDAARDLLMVVSPRAEKWGRNIENAECKTVKF
jgi:hypothetical protein